MHVFLMFSCPQDAGTGQAKRTEAAEGVLEELAGIRQGYSRILAVHARESVHSRETRRVLSIRSV